MNNSWIRKTARLAIILLFILSVIFSNHDNAMNEEKCLTGCMQPFSETLTSDKLVPRKMNGKYRSNPLIDLKPGFLAYPASDPYEPNDNFEDAKEIALNSTQTHSIDPVGDLDISWFVLSIESLVTIETNGSSGDTKLYLYDSDHNFLAYDDEDGFGHFSLIERYRLIPEKYFILVEEHGNDDLISSYTLSLSTEMFNGDPYEPDDDFASAKEIALNSTQTHSIDPANDLDYLFFDLVTPAIVTIETAGLGENDTVLYLYDSNFTLLRENDDGGENHFSLISDYLFSYGRYYLMVEDFLRDDVINSYTVTLSVIELVDYEPNDSFAQATGIALNTSQIHQIYPAGDLDYLTFELVTEALVTIETAGSTGDTFLSLYAADFTLLDSDDDSGSYQFSLIENHALPEGKYFILVEEYENDEVISYYNVSLTTGKITGDPYEPDDDFAHATAIPLNATQSRSIDPVRDKDYLTFELATSSFITIETAGPGDDDTVLSLYDSNFTLIAFDDDDGEGSYSLIVINLLQPGRYYIVVQDYNNNDIIGYYTISLVSAPVAGDSYEPDDSFAQATAMSLNTTQAHSIIPALDVDFLWFELNTFSAVFIETSGPEDSDTVLSLYDSNFTLIASDDDDGEGSYSLIVISLLQPGRYYIKVEDYNDDRISSYTIHLLVYDSMNFEPNDTFGQAVEIDLNTTIIESINPVGDKDYYIFELETEMPVTIKITGSEDGDTVLYLYDERKDIVTSDDDSGDDSYSLIENRALVPGKYYISVEEYGNDDTIDFYAVSLAKGSITGPVTDDDLLLALLLILVAAGFLLAVSFAVYRSKTKVSDESSAVYKSKAGAIEETMKESDRYTRRSGRRYIKRFHKPLTEIVDQPVQAAFGKREDTCWYCGFVLPVDSRTCIACGSERIKCLICRQNINSGREIGVCPACYNKFHYGHLAETVKIFGKCPVCRESVKKEEIKLERIVD